MNRKMPKTSVATYLPSGRFSAAVLLWFAIAVSAGVGLAWLYQMLHEWIPLVYASMLWCVGFGASLGALGASAVRRSHCRNRGLALLLALPLALVPVAASHYWGYRHAVEQIKEKHPQVSPSLAQYLELKRELGWTFSSRYATASSEPDISGRGVTVIWEIEALIVLVFTGFMVWGGAAAPYCEACGRWCEARTLTVVGVGCTDVDAALAAGDFSTVISAKPRGAGDPARSLVLTAHICESCGVTGFLTLDEKTTAKEEGKQTQVKTHRVVQHAVLTVEQRTAFQYRHSLVVGQKKVT
jgi:hypothetical protein